ncbi:HMG high mobility group box-containing protein [Nitzschia inconspicua]|uniref:HMG high mobility group box-containing protein n=1 Tax=Nitzschia inconspicua TaxID=303405 RepID=A0A9K3KPA7_9STRA|nr:HMG high mobility group box-containing protein [Nitzschia inconspicua]
MSSAKKVLRSSENVSKTGNIENNGAQKSNRYGTIPSSYHHPRGHHRYHPPPYYHHRYPSFRTPQRFHPLPHALHDQQLKVINEHPTQQAPPLLQPQPASAAVPAKEQIQQNPPVLPRSAFMCFKDNKKRELMAETTTKESEKQILQVVSRAWRDLSDKERAYWEEQAREDKLRYVREKNDYKGAWNVPKRRAKKHPGAPKRPMSAFLKFSKQVRPKVKKENPDMGNTDVSCLLGEMWRNASPSEKAPYVEEELKERAEYKEKIQKFREQQATLDAATRIPHQSAVNGSHLYQQQEQQAMPKSYPGFERPARGSPPSISFENFTTIDPLHDEPSSTPSAFCLHPSQQYHRQSYHHSEYYYPESYPQATWSALSMDETDPLPVVPPRGQTQFHPTSQANGDDFHHNSFYPTRGNGQFPDTRFQRYP